MRRGKIKKENGDLIKNISDKLFEGKMSVLVGAGFSKNANLAFPSWKELLEKMVTELYKAEYLEWKKKKNKNINNNKFLDEILMYKGYLQIVTEYMRYTGMRESVDLYIENYIKKVEDNESELNYETHKLLLNLPWNNVYTTNYDNLLENTPEVEIDYKVIKNSEELSINGTNKRIIKLHGSLRKKEEIEKKLYGFDGSKNYHYIISETDYENYPNNHSAFTHLMRIALLQEDFCLVGFSGDDPNFVNWIKWVRDIVKEKKDKIYLIIVSEEPISRERELYYSNHGITPVYLYDIYKIDNPKQLINKFFEDLLKLQYKEHEKNIEKWRKILDKNNTFDLKMQLLDELYELGKDFYLPNKEVIVYAKNILFDIENELISKIKENSKDLKENLIYFRVLIILLKNTYMQLSWVVNEEDIKIIKNIIISSKNYSLEEKESEVLYEMALLIAKHYRNEYDYEGLKNFKIEIGEIGNERIRNDFYYEEMLIHVLNGNYIETNNLLKNWNINEISENKWSMVKKAFILGILNENYSKESNLLIQKAYELAENISEKMIFTELLLCYNFSDGNNREKYRNEIEKYKNIGAFSLQEFLEKFYIKENKAKIIGNDENRKITTTINLFGNYDYNPNYGKSLTLTEVILQIGLPIKKNYCAFIGENEFYSVFKVMLAYENVVEAVFLMLFYGGNDSDEKIITRSMQDIVNSELGIENKRKVFKILKNILEYNLIEKKINKKIIFAISEIIEVVPVEDWEELFRKFWENRENYKKQLYTEAHGLGKALKKFLPYLKNEKIIKEIFLENLKILSKEVYPKDLVSENILLLKKAMSVKEFIDNEELNLEISEILKKELSYFDFVKLYYISDELDEENIKKIKQILQEEKFDKEELLLKFEVYLKIVKYDIEIVRYIRKIIFEEKEYLFYCDSKKTFPLEIQNLDEYINILRQYDGGLIEQEINIILERILKILEKLKEKMNNKQKSIFEEPYDEIVFQILSVVNMMKKYSLDDKTEVKIHGIEREIKVGHSEIFGYENLFEGLISHNQNVAYWAMNEFAQKEYLEIENFANSEEEKESINAMIYRIIYNYGDKNEFFIKTFCEFIFEYAKEKKQLKNYISGYLKILEVFKKTDKIFGRDKVFIENNLIKLALVLKNVYEQENEIVKYWLLKKENSEFESVRRNFLAYEKFILK